MPSQEHEPSRRTATTWVLMSVGVVVVLVVAVLLVRAARGSDPVAATTPSAAASASTATSPAPTGSGGASSSSEPTTSTSPPATSARPSPTTTGAAPSTAAPSTDVHTKAPVPIDKPDTVEQGLVARVSRLEAVQAKATGPGEVSGPAVRVTIALSNRSGKAVDLSNTVVNFTYGTAETPASPISGNKSRALPNRLADGHDASGRFVFEVPRSGRDQVTITVDYSVKTPVVAFRGKAPR